MDEVVLRVTAAGVSPDTIYVSLGGKRGLLEGVASQNHVRTYLASALRDGVTVEDAAEHYSALLSPEQYHLLIVERGWTPSRYETWVFGILDRDLDP